MSKQIISKVLGQLTQDDNFEDWWRIDNISVPFFNNKDVQFIFMGVDPTTDTAFIEDADNALRKFVSLTIEDRNRYSDLVYKNCRDTLNGLGYDSVNPELAKLKNPNGIWRFLNPSGIFVSRRDRRDMDIYIAVSCGCDWEEEHGLQLVFKEGKKLTRVSGNDGHITEADAYDIPDEEDELLSKF